MSDKSFGDHINRNIVKNPLLSTAVTGLSIEDLTSNAVLLPVNPVQGLITDRDPTFELATISKNEDSTHGDANSNLSLTNHPPKITPNILDSKIDRKNFSNSMPPLSKACVKTDDDFDVNEYFARLQGTRYVSAPLNSLLKEEQGAILEETEQNLEEINLNEPDRAPTDHFEIQHSLTADIAQNFSQLPTVLPQVASAVFSSFSNILSMKSREQTPDERTTKPSGYQEVQFERPSEEIFLANDNYPPKEVPLPPREPPVGGTANFRLTTKKKYAQIPGLSSAQTQYDPKLNLNPITNVPVGVTPPYPNLFDPSQVKSVDFPQNSGQIDKSNVVGDVNQLENDLTMASHKQTYDLFKPSTEINSSVYSVSNDAVTLKQEPANQSIEPSRMETINLFTTIETQERAAQSVTNTSIIPPPPMFSNLPRKDSNVKGVLPPSVARKISSYQPIIKANYSQSSIVPTNNFFVPAPAVEDPQQSSVPVLSELSGKTSAFVQFDSSSKPSEIKPAPIGVATDIPSGFPAIVSSGEPMNTFIPNSQQISAQETLPGNLLASSFVQQPENAPPPLFFNPNSLPMSTLSLDSSPAPKHGQSQDILSNVIQQSPPQSLFNPNTAQTPLINMPSVQPPPYTPASVPVALETPKPVPEPPKATGNVNYRMTKKRPQYYSGPIEGFGSISNNVVPTIPLVAPTDFQGSMFTPDVQKHVAEEINASNNPPQIDINQQTLPAASFPQFDTSTHSSHNYPTADYITAFDVSRQTTDNYEPPKQESRGFGIIGSLKSKLSSIDINKIQNTVTTFFDPAYNDTKVEPSTEVSNVAYNYSNNQVRDSNFEVFVPNIESSNQYQTQHFAEYNYQNNSYNYGEINQYHQSQGYGNTEQIPTANSYFSPAQNSFPPQQYETGTANKQDTDSTISTSTLFPTTQVESAINYNPYGTGIETPRFPESILNQNFQGSDINTKQTTDRSIVSNANANRSYEYQPIPSFSEMADKKDELPKMEDRANEQDKVSELPRNVLEISAESAINFFDNPQNLVSADINYPEHINTESSTVERKKNPSQDVFSHLFSSTQETNPNPFMSHKNIDAVGSDPLSQNNIDNQNSEIQRTGNDPEPTTSINSVPYSYPLSQRNTLDYSDSKPRDIDILQENKQSDQIVVKESTYTDLNTIVIPNKDTQADDDNDLSICGTCREVNKPEEKEKENLTLQLIENITAPIQLSNPVAATFTESKANEEDTSNFESNQCAEILYIAEETIETLQVQSASELLDDLTKVADTETLNNGWSAKQSFAPSEAILDHNYSFEMDSNAIGFYGKNSMFYENIPNNASDEIKAEFKNSHEDSPIVLNTQMSMSSGEEFNPKSEDTSVLDVHLIEQDANKDFPEFGEIVLEPPSETDDDKIEYKEKERSPDDTVPQMESFTNRVKNFQRLGDSTDNNDNNEIHSGFELPTSTSPAITIASYFDTGNYAAETHYRNSNISPSLSFQLGSRNTSFSIPPGFEDEYKRRLSALAMFEVDKHKLDTPDSEPFIPDTSTQTRPVHTTTFSVATNIGPSITVSSTLKPLEEPQTKSLLNSLFDRQLESGDTLSVFKPKEEESSIASNFNETDPQIVTPQILPDPISFFSSPHESDVKNEGTDNSFNRLASYFTSPAKTEPAKPFFELSQSQNHYRHADSTNKTTNIDEKSNFNKKTELEKNPFDFNDIPTETYLTNLNLINDLISPNNIEINNDDQVVKTVGYFTTELDNDVVIKNDIFERDLKKIDREFVKNDMVHNDDDDDKTDGNERDLMKVVTKCKICCNNDCFKMNITVNKLQLDTDFKVRKTMDSNVNQKDGKVDNRDEDDQTSGDKRKQVTIDLSEPVQDNNEAVTIFSENRSNVEYEPVKHHWFYRVDVEGKSVWRGFSTTDNRALEDAFNSPNLDENTLVPTDGGRFDVNIIGRLRIAVYWSEKPTNVLRCSWFYKGNMDARYVPYSENVAEKLEEEYRIGVTTGKWHRKLVLPHSELVIMHSPSVMVHFPHAPDNFGTPPQTTVRPHVVKRGCDESEIEDAEPSNIDHLLLLCHGVGSACDMRFRSVEEVVDDFRATSLQLLQSHYRSSCDKGVVNRIEVLPISWHATLHSGETGVDRRLAAITLDSIPRLRSFTNDTVLDVLFYTSPVFCQTIIDTVCAELNRIYKLFVSRNPGFSGRVSLGGHSLGSVILYDLLGHQQAEDSNTEKSFVQGSTGAATTVKYPPLAFEPAALYALGSPIAMFECIRGVKLLGPQFSLPTCKNFFNIFHPYDPIAYRIEPLINAQLGTMKPYLIPHHKGRKRMHLELKDTMARVGADLKQKLLESLKATWSSVWRPQTPPTDAQLEKVVEEIEKEHLCEETPESNDLASPEMLGTLNDGRRVDYVLQEAPFEMINEYLFAMRSHVCYWESEDTMLLILREIYDSLGVQPDSTIPQQSMTVQRSRTPKPTDTIIFNTSEFPSTSRDGT